MKTQIKRFLLAVLTCFLFVGCASLERAPSTEVPTPDTTPYDGDDTASSNYLNGFAQGFHDYLAGESTVSTAYHYRSPDARLHGYADGKIEGMRHVKNTAGGKPRKQYAERYSHEEQSWFDEYGNTVGSFKKFKWHGF